MNSVTARIRERLRTTPGRLELISALIVLGALCFGLVAALTEGSREQAAHAVRTETEPLLVDAVTLYSALSDANGTVTTTFLTGGLEPAARRARYLADITNAGGALQRLTVRAGGSTHALGAVAVIAGQLPLYSGLIEAARADNRQGSPIGAAYLRQASELLSATILPAARDLYETEAARLNDDYATGTSPVTLIVLVAFGVLAVGLLIVSQLRLTRLSHRVFNVPVAIGTALVVILAVWAVFGMASEQSALAKAQRDGSDPVEVLSATQILLSRAQGDESLALVARGGGAANNADFDAAIATLAGNSGIVGQAAALIRRTADPSSADQLATAFASYRDGHAQIAKLEQDGRIIDAINLAVRSGSSQSSPADQLASNLSRQTAGAQARFATSAADATSSLNGLSIAIPIVTVLAAALALFGLRQRLNEYR
jgi:hypothetical protein